MSNDADTVSKGTSLGGCIVQEQLSERAGAVRYRATDEAGQDCCVTVYQSDCFPSALVRERSLRELRQLTSLENPSLLRVREVGKLEDESGVFEVNDLPAGKSLAQWDQPLGEDQVFTVLRAIGDSLLAAQNVGVIHRNLGPEVIFFEGDKPGKSIKVAGFAVAEPHGDGSFGPLQTIAPEQVAGKVVDQRSMVYNLAALGHRLLTGKNLYEGSVQDQLKQHLEAPLPDQVHERFVRALQKEARRRPMMLKQFLDELSSAAASSGAGGAKAADAQKPSTRGWTQFMDDDEVEGGSSSGSSQAPAASAPTEVKPSTRGWTMFMESEDAEPEPAPAPAPAPAVAQENQPKTRGWTMFMDGPEEAAQGEAPGTAQPEPEPKKPAAASQDKPKTRGWTMFMEEDPVAAATKGQSPAPAKDSAPAPQIIADPEPARPAVAASAHGPATGSTTGPALGKTNEAAPSTRGWTMFMDAPPGSDQEAQATAPDSPAAAGAGVDLAVDLAADLAEEAQSEFSQQPSANGDGLHFPSPGEESSPAPTASATSSASGSETESEESSGPAKPFASKKSAVEASNRRVAIEMPKPEDSLSAQASEPEEKASPVPRARTMVMGGQKSSSSSAPSSKAAAPAAPGDLAAKAAQPLSTPELQESQPQASLSTKNPIPESPAPIEQGEPSIARVALGAGVAGIVLAGIVLLLVYVLS